jgi:hypothetical protein
LVDFLVSRSKGFTEQPPADYNPKSPPLVVPGRNATAAAAPELPSVPRAMTKPVVVSIRN